MLPVARVLTVLCAFCGLSLSAQAQDFLLENPLDPAAASTASIIGTDLVITDAGGRQFVYVRRPDLDTTDGSFQAFFSTAANQYLRWPVIGAGNMQIGKVVAGTLVWSPSRMQVRSGSGGPVGPGTFIPGSPLNIGTLPIGTDRICAAQIDAAGQLHFFIGHGERWRHFSAEHPPGILVPGAPVHVVPDTASPVPRVYTIGAHGKFIEVVGGSVISDLPAPPGVKFVPGGQFASVQTATSSHLFATERHGRLWRIDLTGGMHQTIEGHLGVLEPGLPIQAMRDGRELFMTDRHGAIVVYSLDAMGVWHGPEILADGFSSAGQLAAWFHPGTTSIEVAAVDRHGKLQVLHHTGGVWTKDTIPGITLLAGSPLTAFETAAGLSLTAILADGRWAEFFESGGTWHDRIIAAGFPPRAPLAFNRHGPTLFASDITGRLIAAFWIGTEWHAVICVPGDFVPGQIAMAPRLVSRKIIANRRIDPVVVTLQNTTPEELIVRVMDARIPGKVEEIKVAPNGEAPFSADRDAGGTLEEVYLVPGPGGPVRQVRQIPLPPKQFYDLVVYANRVTYQYIDRRKNKGPVPDFTASTPVSLGTFPLPPGPLLTSDLRLDVYRIATTTRNPGAAAILDPAATPQP